MIKIEAIVMSVLHVRVATIAEGEPGAEHTVVKTVFRGGSGLVKEPSLVCDDRQVPLEFQYPGEPQHQAGEVVTLLIRGEEETQALLKIQEARAARRAAGQAATPPSADHDVAEGG